MLKNSDSETAKSECCRTAGNAKHLNTAHGITDRQFDLLQLLVSSCDLW